MSEQHWRNQASMKQASLGGLFFSPRRGSPCVSLESAVAGVSSAVRCIHCTAKELIFSLSCSSSTRCMLYCGDDTCLAIVEFPASRAEINKLQKCLPVYERTWFKSNTDSSKYKSRWVARTQLRGGVFAAQHYLHTYNIKVYLGCTRQNQISRSSQQKEISLHGT